LTECPEAKIELIGHTDTRGSVAHNLQLSADRAEAVRSWLVEYGLEPGNVAARGLGESQAVPDHRNGRFDEEIGSRNRRVDAVLVDD